ncbi:polysaccharide deacetylase family protein [Vibrio rarus]|uniref:polysaccharide deacetylase family protein n=1 Tax=Vibrio rarus TaxID=413403 RepID=UPI0021C39E24|nr:polysaccharide deacetylase family protein [Vibrio rarus]
MQKNNKITILLVFILFTLPSQGVAKLVFDSPAIIEQDERIYNISSIDEFNKASETEILIHAFVLNKLEKENFHSLDFDMDVDSEVSREWVEIQKKMLLNNYSYASGNSLEWSDLIYKAIAREDINSKVNSIRFHTSYIREQLRLFILSSKVSSEIKLLSQNEISGDDFPDLVFYLTYDDGMDDNVTPKVISSLRKNDLTASFFALGYKLRKPNSIYKDNCLYSHGFEHNIHAETAATIKSVRRTNKLVEGYERLNEKHAFRPPYGMRSKKTSLELQALDIPIVLWNIDSQDWHKSMTSNLVSDRVISLMLLKRRGVILFHDTNDKSLPLIDTIGNYSHSGLISIGQCKGLITK